MISLSDFCYGVFLILSQDAQTTNHDQEILPNPLPDILCDTQHDGSLPANKPVLDNEASKPFVRPRSLPYTCQSSKQEHWRRCARSPTAYTVAQKHVIPTAGRPCESIENNRSWPCQRANCQRTQQGLTLTTSTNFVERPPVHLLCILPNDFPIGDYVRPLASKKTILGKWHKRTTLAVELH